MNRDGRYIDLRRVLIAIVRHALADVSFARESGQ